MLPRGLTEGLSVAQREGSHLRLSYHAITHITHDFQHKPIAAQDAGDTTAAMSSAGQGQAYNGRRAPNVSQYLQNLNTISSGHDLPSDINLGEGDLDFLTNAEFFDFETSTFNPNVDAFHARSPHDDEAPPKGRRVAVSGTFRYQLYG